MGEMRQRVRNGSEMGLGAAINANVGPQIYVPHLAHTARMTSRIGLFPPVGGTLHPTALMRLMRM